MQHAGTTLLMHMKVWSANLNGWDHVRNTGEDGRIILKKNREIGCESGELTGLALDSG